MAQEQEFNYLLAKHCAPALAGIKPANLVPCAQAALPVVSAYHERLKKQDIYLEFIPCRFGPSLLLVYRKPQLFQVLACPDVQAFLKKTGYPVSDGPEAMLRHLKKRIQNDADGFPHEIGVFLGYPLGDVLGFTVHKGKDALLTGYWKVYTNTDAAQALFRRYTLCRDVFCRQVAAGRTILHLLHAT